MSDELRLMGASLSRGVVSGRHLSFHLHRADSDTWQVRLEGPAATEVVARLAEVVHLADVSTKEDAVSACVAADDYHEAERFLRFASEVFPVPVPAGEVWVFHPPEKGKSEWSGLLRQAKPRHGEGDLGAARQLGRRMARTMRLHPGITRADAVVPVPDATDKRPYSLPYILAEMIADILGIAFVPGMVRKSQATPEAKNLTPMERRILLAGSFVTCGGPRRRVVVVDDVVETGATVTAVARALEADGTAVVSVAAAYRGDAIT